MYKLGLFMGELKCDHPSFEYFSTAFGLMSIMGICEVF
jgi:hypothetical protein